MEKDEARKNSGLLHLIRWCALPVKQHELFPILRGMTDAELLLAATKIKGAAGRVAWAEYGRRLKYFDFDISVTTGSGKIEVKFEAKGPPAHTLPQFS